VTQLIGRARVGRRSGEEAYQKRVMQQENERFKECGRKVAETFEQRRRLCNELRRDTIVAGNIIITLNPKPYSLNPKP